MGKPKKRIMGSCVALALLLAVAQALFVLDPLPYARDALEPHYSNRTLFYHHGKHHAGYVSKANQLLEAKLGAGSSWTNADLDAHLLEAGEGPLFNSLAQARNHDLFWQSMLPGGGGEPADQLLAAALARDFGSVAEFRTAFRAAALGVFWIGLDVAGGRCGRTTA